MFIASHATKPHLVDVFAVAGVHTIGSHHDLDIYQWLPGHPLMLDHFAPQGEFRVAINVKKKKSQRPTRYLVIYYKQVLLAVRC